MIKYLKKLTPVIFLTASAVIAGGLAGCDNAAYVAPPPPPVQPPPPPPTTQKQFGAGFEAAFNKDRFDEPNPVMDGDIIDLDKTIDPVDIPDPDQ